jgi:hypothetical protein
MPDEASAGLEESLLEARQGPVLDEWSTTSAGSITGITAITGCGYRGLEVVRHVGCGIRYGWTLCSPNIIQSGQVLFSSESTIPVISVISDAIPEWTAIRVGLDNPASAVRDILSFVP